jgi:hypothetical protein
MKILTVLSHMDDEVLGIVVNERFKLKVPKVKL